MVLTYLHFRILKFPLIYDKYITCRGTTTKEAVSVLSRFGSNSTSDLTGVRRFGHLDSNCGSSKNIYIGDRHHQILKIIYISLSNSERYIYIYLDYSFGNHRRLMILDSRNGCWSPIDSLVTPPYQPERLLSTAHMIWTSIASLSKQLVSGWWF